MADEERVIFAMKLKLEGLLKEGKYTEYGIVKVFLEEFCKSYF